MADSKITEYTAITAAVASDSLLLARTGGNARITVGTLANTMPALGNVGISKNVPTVASGTITTVDKTLYKIGAATTLGSGQSGQSVTVLFTASAPLTLAGTGFTTITGAAGSSVSLVFDTTWYITSSYSVSIA